MCDSDFTMVKQLFGFVGLNVFGVV